MALCQDPLYHLLRGEMGGLDLQSVGRDRQRAVVARQVGPVTCLHLSPELIVQGLLAPALKLPPAPGDSDLGRGIEIDPAVGVGEHHGAGVPPHQQPPLPGRLTLKVEQGRAHLGLAGRARQQGGMPGVPELGSQRATIDQSLPGVGTGQGIRVGLEIQPGGELGESGAIAGCYPPAAGGDGQSPVARGRRFACKRKPEPARSVRSRF